MSDFISIVRKYKLNELSMVLKDVNSDDSFIIFFICAVYFFIILSIFVLQKLKTDTDKLE